MIKVILVMSTVAVNCYAMDGTQTDKNDVAGLTTRLNEQTLSDNQSPAAQLATVETRRVPDPKDYMLTIYDDGGIVYGEGL